MSIDEALVGLEAVMRLRELSDRHISSTKRTASKAARDMQWASVEDITAASVRELLTKLQADGRSPKTRNEYRSALSLLCTYAVDEGWMRENPIGRTPRAKLVKRRARRVPTIDEVRRLIEAAKRDWRKRDRWLVYLTAATTGLRWGQLKRLEWCHVRLDTDPPHLDLPADLCKNGEAAVVWLTAEVAAALAASRGVEYQFVPNAGAAPPGMVFQAVPKPTSFNRDLEAAGLAKAGPGGATLSFHSLRHFSSNRMSWLGGFTTAERQRQNQHRTEAMTTGIYTDPANIELGRKVLHMPDLLASSVGVDGESADRGLTDADEDAEMSGAEMTQAPPTTHDSKAPAPAVGVISADYEGTRAAASAPRNRVDGGSESGRLDSNQRHPAPKAGALPS